MKFKRNILLENLLNPIFNNWLHRLTLKEKIQKKSNWFLEETAFADAERITL